MLRLKSKNDDLIEFCETLVSLKKDYPAIAKQQEKKALCNIIRNLTNIDNYLNELEKEIRFL